MPSPVAFPAQPWFTVPSQPLLPSKPFPPPAAVASAPSNKQVRAAAKKAGKGAGSKLSKSEKKAKGRKAKAQAAAHHALFQDEKYTLGPTVWKIVAGQMMHVHDVPAVSRNLPLTKIIAAKKADAIAIHDRLLKTWRGEIYYSDGSFKEGWAWGAAVEWVRDGSPREGKRLREELGQCDPTDAECSGMRKALEAFASVGKPQTEDLLIFADSQAAITLVDSGVRYQSQLFVSTFEKILTLRPDVKITIVWVPSHNGILGNELADRTAVSGTVTTVLARRAGKLPSPGDANESALPVVLSRRLVADEDSVELPTDDTLVFSEGSICVARFPVEATAGDLEDLFGQFGQLISIDIFNVPPVEDRFAIISFSDPTVSTEVIRSHHDKPIDLSSDGRDESVWKKWPGSLLIAPIEVGRLVPDGVAEAFPKLPPWALKRKDENADQHQTNRDNKVEIEAITAVTLHPSATPGPRSASPQEAVSVPSLSTAFAASAPTSRGGSGPAARQHHRASPYPAPDHSGRLSPPTSTAPSPLPAAVLTPKLPFHRELKASLDFVKSRQQRLTIIEREPHDWNLAIGSLGRVILENQQALEAIRRTKIRGMGDIRSWEARLEHECGILPEKALALIADSLATNKGETSSDTTVIEELRREIETESAALTYRLALLPSATASIVHSCEELLARLHEAFEEDNAFMDEVSRTVVALAELFERRRSEMGR